MSQKTAPHNAKSSFAVSAILFNKPIDFVVDTGADVSILPANFKTKAIPIDIQLRAANNTKIKSYGYLQANVTFPQLRRSFEMKFLVADVKSPLLGADFFEKHKLLIDVSGRRLVDSETKFSVSLAQVNSDTTSISVIDSPNHSIIDVVIRNSSVFDITAERPTPSITFSIETSEIPKPTKAYKLSPEKVKAAKSEITNEIKLGRMTRSSSQYASPFFPVKKPDGSWRFVADYTKLNNVTVKDNYVPPRIDDLLSRISRGCVYSKLDLQKAFFQIPINPADQHKTAVATPFGLYEYKVMPMGLKNASQTLQRYIDTILNDSVNTIAYCDDILLFTSEAEHAKELDKLLKTLHEAGLVVNKNKSEFYVKELDFLGHKLNATGYHVTDTKIKALQDFTPPKTLRQLRRFLGLINFYRKFIPHASEIQKPLTALTHKNATYTWSNECQRAFETLINSVLHASQLVYPSEEDEYTLTTDASGVAVGAVLSSQFGPIAFYSKQLKDAELNYSVYDKELTAVFQAVTYFEWLLFGKSFKLQVDHKPLQHMFTTPTKCERRRRHIQFLSTFDIKIEYLPGKENVVADTLSRHSIDAISINPCLYNLSSNEIIHEQEKDNDLQRLSNRNCDSGVWRDSDGRLFVPTIYRHDLIDSIHNVSHSGVHSTTEQIRSNYIWPNMRKQIQMRVGSCTDCQSSKITKHIKPPYKSLGQHPKFSTIHIDFVGPLPINQNKRFLVTIFDRRTRWFSAYPTSSATAESATNALMLWVSDHGVPEIIISDRGSHFESKLFKELTKKLGIEKRRTTAFHPSTNGAVERQHRRLKDALKAKSNSAPRDWLKNLPLVLLGLRNAISKDTGQSSSQAVYGRQLNVPGCIFDDESCAENSSLPQRNFIRRDAFVPESMERCTQVWIGKHGIQPSLVRPYSGPYQVLKKNFDNHTLTVMLNGKSESISMERCKPVWSLLDPEETKDSHKKASVSFMDN